VREAEAQERVYPGSEMQTRYLFYCSTRIEFKFPRCGGVCTARPWKQPCPALYDVVFLCPAGLDLVRLGKVVIDDVLVIELPNASS
jgi:hypothetical protein